MAFPAPDVIADEGVIVVFPFQPGIDRIGNTLYDYL
jgi:hypothetical protein